LRLVKNQNAARQIVQFAAARGPIAKQRLEKLYGRREDDRRVPVFGGEIALVALAAVVLVRFIFDVRIVRNNAAPAKNGLKHRLRLFDDAAIGDDVDHAAQVLLLACASANDIDEMVFPLPVGAVNVKSPGFFLPSRNGCPQDLAAFFVELAFRVLQPRGRVRGQAFHW
jgi:hypothetical protein